MKRKTVALLLACALLLGTAIGGTMAWLTDKTAPITNTFLLSDISITLTEGTKTNITGGTDYQYQMLPGCAITKDPKVTVSANSEDCWLFITMEKSSTADDYLAYAVDTEVWTELTGNPLEGTNLASGTKVYYYKEKVAKNTNPQDFSILTAGSHTLNGTAYTWTANQVLVKPEVTKEDMAALQAQGAVQPTLTFTAYACQYWEATDDAFTPTEAWDKVKPVAQQQPTP